MNSNRNKSELLAEMAALRQRVVELEALKREYEWVEEELTRVSFYDSLTGLPNRLLFFNKVSQAVGLARHEHSQVAVLCFGIDRFKLINDNFGENTTDLLLLEVAARLNSCLRKSDVLSRPGRGEFLILLPDMDSREEVVHVAEKVFEAMLPPVLLEDQELVITANIGVSIHPENGAVAEVLVRRAYAAMYRAREKGRNLYRFYSPRLNERELNRLLMENSLRLALQREEFSLHYQPQADLASGRLIGAEALLRWNHHDFGTVSPAVFIPIAEEIGIIGQLSEWVLRTACAQNRALQQAGIPPICMAVNLSPAQLLEKDLVATVARILDETGLEPRYLELELTEGALVRNVTATAAAFHALNDMGVKVAIDDFGTGYSSLSYLRYFPISKLKIDKIFVDSITTDQSNAAISRAIIALAHGLHLKVIAEGVETVEQLEFLKALGCHEVQGYLIGRPVSAAELSALLTPEISCYHTQQAGKAATAQPC